MTRIRRAIRRAWSFLRGEDPFQEARVRLGPPRKPLLSGAVALPLPEPEDRDVDADGR